MASDRFALTGGALERLLDRLDEDRERAAEKYETLRTGLIRFFEWRGGLHSEALADETIDRVARKIEEGEEIHNVRAYAAGVARFVFLEMLHARRRDEALRKDLPLVTVPAGDDARIDCVRRCLETLPPENARLVLAYYENEAGEKIRTRQKLADQLGISVSHLRVRLQRLRAKLQECTTTCLEQDVGHAPASHPTAQA